MALSRVWNTNCMRLLRTHFCTGIGMPSRYTELEIFWYHSRAAIASPTLFIFESESTGRINLCSIPDGNITIFSWLQLILNLLLFMLKEKPAPEPGDLCFIFLVTIKWPLFMKSTKKKVTNYHLLKRIMNHLYMHHHLWKLMLCLKNFDGCPRINILRWHESKAYLYFLVKIWW